MTVETPEVIKMITWLNSIDGRVMLNEPSVEMWAHAMAPFEASEAKQAILDHYRNNEQFAATHAGIRKRALAVRDVRAAQQSAIAGPSKAPAHPLGWRARNPELWDRLFEEGKQARRADLAARGLL